LTDTFHLRAITVFVWILIALAASLPVLGQLDCELTLTSQECAKHE
jgi:hypothetical protein